MNIPYVYKAVCTRVIDGDTVQLVIDVGFYLKAEHRIRLLGVDTPELNDKDESKRELAKKAKARVEELLLGETVFVQTSKADSFGRWLGIITLPDGRNLGTVLIQEGLAEPYKK